MRTKPDGNCGNCAELRLALKVATDALENYKSDLASPNRALQALKRIREAWPTWDQAGAGSAE